MGFNDKILEDRVIIDKSGHRIQKFVYRNFSLGVMRVNPIVFQNLKIIFLNLSKIQTKNNNIKENLRRV